jgi:hypothetical protein
MMWLDEFTPCAIAQSGYPLGRANQIREENGCENSFQLGFFLERCEEVLKFSQHAFPITRERGMFFAGQLDDPCVLQLVSDVSGLLNSLIRIVRPVHDQRRDGNGVEQRSNVRVAPCPLDGQSGSWRGRQARVASPRFDALGIASNRRVDNGAVRLPEVLGAQWRSMSCHHASASSVVQPHG